MYPTEFAELWDQAKGHLSLGIFKFAVSGLIYSKEFSHVARGPITPRDTQLLAEGDKKFLVVHEDIVSRDFFTVQGQIGLAF